MTLQSNANGKPQTQNRPGFAAGSADVYPPSQRYFSATGQAAERYRLHRDLAWGAFHWFNSDAYPQAHQQDEQAPVYGQHDQRDLSGGWYDGPDYGHYSVTAAWSIALPLLTWMIRPQALPERIQPLHSYNPGRPAILDLVRPQLHFLLSLQRGDGAMHHKLTSAESAALSDAPQADHRTRWLMPVSTTATANFAATAHLAARAFERSPLAEDWLLAQRCQTAAKQADQFLDAHLEAIHCLAATSTGSFGQAYQDDDERDNRLWAKVARHWSDTQPLHDQHYCRLWELAGTARLGDDQPGWQQLNFLALFNFLAMPEQDSTLKDALLTRMEKTFQAERERQLTHPYGRLNWHQGAPKDDHNGTLATLGTQLLWLHQLTGRQRWYDTAFDLSPWFFGHNPNATIWTTGGGETQVQQPRFAPLISGALQAAPGILVRGGAAETSTVNEPTAATDVSAVSIEWQASWACYLSLLVAGPR
ncbi:glycoside hydrolase family 9 protein [Saccharospirillum sp. HFRX-1]|uniref:glycoside hydrolase family 9 protein n=1 Tax=unclassified Saccharospirillum TaxID=2633430 RepID=UPI0037161BB3